MNTDASGDLMSVNKLCKATVFTLAIIGLSIARGFAIEEQTAAGAQSQIQPTVLEVIVGKAKLNTEPD